MARATYGEKKEYDNPGRPSVDKRHNALLLRIATKEKQGDYGPYEMGTFIFQTEEVDQEGRRCEIVTSASLFIGKDSRLYKLLRGYYGWNSVEDCKKQFPQGWDTGDLPENTPLSVMVVEDTFKGEVQPSVLNIGPPLVNVPPLEPLGSNDDDVPF